MAYRVPDSLLEPVTIPELCEPVYVETLLVHINELETTIEMVNQRFEEIRILQK